MPRFDQIGKFAVLSLATGLGVGHCPVLPGTVGSLWGLLPVWLLARTNAALPVWAAVTAILVAAGVPVCGRAAALMGGEDPSPVVFDELAALPLVFFAVPVDLATVAGGFLWFRLFDILKPWPLDRLQKLPGGVGIVADDVGAAVYAAAALWLSVRMLSVIGH